MGALVNTPLVNLKKLTGRDGVLDMHQIYNFHKTCQIRVAEFGQRVAGGGVHPQDILDVNILLYFFNRSRVYNSYRHGSC